MRKTVILLLSVAVPLLAVTPKLHRHLPRDPQNGAKANGASGSDTKVADTGRDSKDKDKSQPVVNTPVNTTGTVICNIRGYLKSNPPPYFSSTNTQYASITLCGTHCLQDNLCKSYSYGGAGCSHYTAPLAENLIPNLFSTNTFFDRGCPNLPVSSTSSSRSSSSSTSSSTSPATTSSSPPSTSLSPSSSPGSTPPSTSSATPSSLSTTSSKSSSSTPSETPTFSSSTTSSELPSTSSGVPSTSSGAPSSSSETPSTSSGIPSMSSGAPSSSSEAPSTSSEIASTSSEAPSSSSEAPNTSSEVPTSSSSIVSSTVSSAISSSIPSPSGLCGVQGLVNIVNNNNIISQSFTPANSHQEGCAQVCAIYPNDCKSIAVIPGQGCYTFSFTAAQGVSGSGTITATYYDISCPITDPVPANLPPPVCGVSGIQYSVRVSGQDTYPFNTFTSFEIQHASLSGCKGLCDLYGAACASYLFTQGVECIISFANVALAVIQDSSINSWAYDANCPVPSCSLTGNTGLVNTVVYDTADAYQGGCRAFCYRSPTCQAYGFDATSKLCAILSGDVASSFVPASSTGTFHYFDRTCPFDRSVPAPNAPQFCPNLVASPDTQYLIETVQGSGSLAACKSSCSQTFNCRSYFWDFPGSACSLYLGESTIVGSGTGAFALNDSDCP